MLELEATFHATIPIIHLSALKAPLNLIGPKGTNILGKAIILGRVRIDNHLVALWSMRILM